MKKRPGDTEPVNGRQVLKQRARALARRIAPAPAPEAMLEVLEFRLAHERYAVETRHVREVSPLKSLTPLPTRVHSLLGIVNVRGRIVPVYDIRRFFGLPETGLTDLHRVILVHGHGLELGLLAEAIGSVRSILRETLQPSLPTLTGLRADYLKGITAEALVVLDLDRILVDPRIVVQDEPGD